MTIHDRQVTTGGEDLQVHVSIRDLWFIAPIEERLVITLQFVIQDDPLDVATVGLDPTGFGLRLASG